MCCFKVKSRFFSAVYLICSAHPWPLHCGVLGGVWRQRMWRGRGPQGSGWGLHCGPGRAAHLAETDQHLPNRGRYMRAKKREHVSNINMQQTRSCRSFLYSVQFQLHVGIKIIWFPPRNSLILAPLRGPMSTKWNKDMHLTDANSYC